MVSRHVAVVGIGVARHEEAPVAAGHNSIGVIISRAAQGLLPDDAPRGVEPYHPIVLTAVVSRHVAVVGIGVARHDKAPVAAGHDVISIITTRAAQGLLPDLVARGVKLDHPIVCIAVVSTHVAIVGAGMARHDEAPVAASHDGSGIIITRAAQGLLPEKAGWCLGTQGQAGQQQRQPHDVCS